MSLENKLKYEQSQDLLSNWLETDTDYLNLRNEKYQEHKKLFYAKTSQNTNFFTNIIMSYTKITNFITKNAVVATIIMILAVGGASTAAAQFFAPEEYKPSTFFSPTKLIPKVTNFEECKNAGGKIVQTTSLPSTCQYEGNMYQEKVTVETIASQPEVQYSFCQRVNPYISASVQTGWTCIPTTEGDTSEMFSYSVEAQNFSLSISNGGRGICEMNKNCKYNEFVKTEFCKIDKITGISQDTNEFIYWGSCKIAGQDVGTVVSIKEGFVNSDELEVKKLLESLKFENQTGIKVYTNSIYPTLEIQYPSSWSVTEVKDNNNLLKSLTFANSYDVLEYTFTSFPKETGVGGPKQECTLNENVYLTLQGDWSRIRQNDQTRIYVNSLKMDVELGDPNNDGPSPDIFPDLTSGWVDTLTRMDQISYIKAKACHGGFTKIVETTSTDGWSSAITEIKLVKFSDRMSLAEADQIVTSTKF